MNTYKITNITNLLPKRDRKFNAVVDMEYVDKMLKKTIKVKPNDSVFLTVPILPLSVHRLRLKNLITVLEVPTKTAMKKPVKAPKKAAKPKAVKKTEATAKKTTVKKGRPATKKTTEE